MSSADLFRIINVGFCIAIILMEIDNLKKENQRWKFIKVLKIFVATYLIFIYAGLLLGFPIATEIAKTMQTGIMSIVLLTWVCSILRDKVRY